MSYKVLLWGTKNEFQTRYHSIKRQEAMGKLFVVGVSSEDTIYKSVWGYSFVDELDIASLAVDLVIVMAPQKMLPDIYSRLKDLGIPRSKCLRGDVLSLPGFDLERYMQLRNQPISIIADNCFGGILYHQLDLPFCSPMINLWLPPSDFLKLVLNLKSYMGQVLQFERIAWDSVTKINYPVMRLGDLHLHFNHEESPENAIACWERRKAKLDYAHIFVFMRAEHQAILQEFERIPYRKFCFTGFRSGKADTLYLPLTAGRSFLWEMENGSASGMYQIFDPIKLLQGQGDYLVSELVESE